MKPWRLKNGRKGGQPLLVEVTPLGWEVLKKYGVNVQKPRGKGGFLHKAFQHFIARYFAVEGWLTTIEDGSSGKYVDVGLVRNDQRIAVEVLVKGEVKELSNVAKDLEDWDAVILCCDAAETIERMKKRITAEFGIDILSQVRFRLLSDFIPA